ncbi:MAG: hypothetical protein U9R32_07215 [Bacteroidota bacterium]|nr:hypothetical protein [Bacteroidota bacterium]
MYKKSGFIFLFLLVPFFLKAQLQFNENCREIYSLISDFQFKKAQQLIDEERNSHPDNAIAFYLEDFADFLKVFVSEDKIALNIALENLDLRMEKIKECDADSPYYLYCRGEMYLHWAFTRMKFDQNVKAVWDLNKAYRLFEKNEKKYPGFTPNKITLGLLHALIGTIPDKYTWVAEILSYNGTIAEGRKEILSAIYDAEQREEYQHLKTTAIFILSFIDMNLLKEIPEETERLFYNEFSERKVLGKPLMLFVYSDFFAKEKKNEKVLNVLKQYRPQKQEYPFYFLVYLRGLANLNKLNLKDAREDFKEYVSDFEGRHYIKSAYQKIAWSYLLEGDTINYYRFIRKVRDNGFCLIDADKQAKNEFDNKKQPITFLLKSRLLFDGGYFLRALETLENGADYCYTDNCTTEMYYRKARIFDELDEAEEAVYWYKKTLDTEGDLSRFFVPNAALKIGQIYERSDQIIKARYYYQKCLDMDGFDYEFSIHNKAKAGMNRTAF